MTYDLSSPVRERERERGSDGGDMDDHVTDDLCSSKCQDLKPELQLSDI